MNAWFEYSRANIMYTIEFEVRNVLGHGIVFQKLLILFNAEKHLL